MCVSASVWIMIPLAACSNDAKKSPLLLHRPSGRQSVNFWSKNKKSLHCYFLAVVQHRDSTQTFRSGKSIIPRPQRFYKQFVEKLLTYV
nr:MAG TPA: hypothetical protein [Caudoviricetes sp.]